MEQRTSCVAITVYRAVTDIHYIPPPLSIFFFSPLAITSVGLGILSGEVSQIFIPEKSKFLILMAFLGCSFYICPFTFKIGQMNPEDVQVDHMGAKGTWYTIVARPLHDDQGQISSLSSPQEDDSFHLFLASRV